MDPKFEGYCFSPGSALYGEVVVYVPIGEGEDDTELLSVVPEQDPDDEDLAAAFTAVEAARLLARGEYAVPAIVTVAYFEAIRHERHLRSRLADRAAAEGPLGAIEYGGVAIAQTARRYAAAADWLREVGAEFEAARRRRSWSLKECEALRAAAKAAHSFRLVPDKAPTVRWRRGTEDVAVAV